MPVREQFAWVWLVTMVVTYGIYFAVLIVLQHRTLSLWTELGLFGATVAAQFVILGAWNVINFTRKREARKVDERDKAIEHRGASIAYAVLLVEMLFVGCVYPFYLSGWDMVHHTILAIVIAEIVRQAAVVLWYRRGWHA